MWFFLLTFTSLHAYFSHRQKVALQWEEKMDEQSSNFALAAVKNNVGTIALNRPHSLNAFNLQMAEQILKYLAEFERDNSVRVIVIRGEGRVFSAGGDVKEMLGYVKDGKDRAAYFRAPLASFGKIVIAIRRIPKPVVAAVHGAVAGVAFNLMLACDLVLAEESTRFSQAFIKLGLSPDGGGTWFLPRRIGYARTCELIYLPAEINANRAHELGLINWIAPEVNFEKKLNEVTEALVNSPSVALGRAKLLLNEAYYRNLEEHIETERLLQVENAAEADFEEGLIAFVEKRKPRF